MGRSALFLASVILAAALVLPVAANAVILPTAEISQPTMPVNAEGEGVCSTVRELGDADVSEDGSGGLVFLCVDPDDGLPHVYASALRGGTWSPARRVDLGQKFESFQPRIGASDGGRLVVTWIQRGPASDDLTRPRHDSLWSATLDPGATIFERPVPIDMDVGQQDAVFPDVSVNRDGQGYIVYRVVKRFSGSDLPPGYIEADLRAARYNGWTWSRLDQVLDRNPSAIVPQPTADNAPSISTDRYGNAIVAFQEPGDDFVNRIWVRRLFGLAQALPLIASPTTYNGSPLRGHADRPVLATGPFGNAMVSFRQDPGTPPLFDRARMFTNLLPDQFALVATVFNGPVAVDNGAASSADPYSGFAGAVSTRQKFFALFGRDGTAQATEGTDAGLLSEGQIGGDVAADAQPGITLADDDARTMAWITGSGSDQRVRVIETNSDGATTTQDASTSAGGPIARLRFSGTINTDAIAAFEQGTGTYKRIAAVRVDARPGQFIVFEPDDWSRAKRTVVEWEPAFDTGAVGYDVFVDGNLSGRFGGHSADLGTRVRDGARQVQVIAVDQLGQRRESAIVSIRLDRKAPTVTIKRLRKGVVKVTVKDGRAGRVSGVASRTSIAWGDGKKSRTRGSKVRRYKGSQRRVKLTVTAVDRAGNRRIVRRSVKLR